MRYLILGIIGMTLLLPGITSAYQQRENCPPEPLVVLRHVASLPEPCGPVDADSDGEITAIDALWLLREGEWQCLTDADCPSRTPEGGIIFPH